MKLVVGLGNPGREYENTRHNVGFLVLDKLRTESTKHQAPNYKPQYQSVRGGQYQNSNFQMNKKFNAEVCQIGDVLLAKPQTFMNDSGKSVAAIVSFYKIDMDDLYVVHDDLDIVMGDFKLQKAKGPKIHNGVNDIEIRLGRNDFWRVRIGVDSRSQQIQNQKSQISNHSTSRYVTSKFQFLNFLNKKQDKIPGRQYVLMKLGSGEKEVLDRVSSLIVAELQSKLVV